MMDGEQLKRNILKDMRTELADEFDKNFDRKAFFTKNGNVAQIRTPKARC